MKETGSYVELLRDPRWQKKRLAILRRDQFTCQACSAQRTELHVDHSFYIRRVPPWQYPNKSLVTLCADCHADLETARGLFRKASVGLHAMSIGILAGIAAGMGTLESSSNFVEAADMGRTLQEGFQLGLGIWCGIDPSAKDRVKARFMGLVDGTAL